MRCVVRCVRLVQKYVMRGAWCAVLGFDVPYKYHLRGMRN